MACQGCRALRWKGIRKHYALYEATQRQRNLEASIRKQRRRILIDEATGDEQKLQADQIKGQLLKQEYGRFSKAAGLRQQHDRMETVGYNWKQEKVAARKYNASLDGGQSYKPVTRGESAIFSPKGGETVSVKSISGYENVYISDNATIKPKALHDINKNTVDAMKEWGVSGDIKPKTVILSNDEMPTAYGRYNAVTNTVYYTPDIASKEIMESNGGAGSVEYHEMWHLKQAADFRAKGWVITENNYRNYMDALIAQCKINVDKLGITEYNVSEISQYAKKMYFIGRYDEVEAEYMVKKRRSK